MDLRVRTEAFFELNAEFFYIVTAEFRIIYVICGKPLASLFRCKEFLSSSFFFLSLCYRSLIFLVARFIVSFEKSEGG